MLSHSPRVQEFGTVPVLCIYLYCIFVRLCYACAIAQARPTMACIRLVGASMSEPLST